MKKVAKLCMIVLASMTICLVGCSREIYNGQISGPQGGKISAENLAIVFPAGITNNNINLTINSSTDVPAIKGTERQLEAYKNSRFIGPIYKIGASPNQFNSPYYLTLKLNPDELNEVNTSEILNVVLISDNGTLAFPAVYSRSLKGDVVTIRATHFCDIGFLATNPGELATLANAFAANVTGNNRAQKVKDAIDERDRVQSDYEQAQKEYEATMAKIKQKSANQQQTAPVQVKKPTPPSPVNIPETNKNKIADIYKEYVYAKNDYDALIAKREIPSGETDHNKIQARYHKAYQAYVNATK